MKVKDLMHNGAICVEPSTPVKDIAKRMRDDDVGALTVKANGHLVGIVTDRDITCRAFTHGDNLSKLTAENVMTSNVVCCSPEDDIGAAIHVMEFEEDPSPAGDGWPEHDRDAQPGRYFAQGEQGAFR